MPRQRNIQDSDVSMASKWDQLSQEEDQLGDKEVDMKVDREMKSEEEEVVEAVTVKTRLQQMRESSSRTFVSLKNQVSEIYRKSWTKTTASTTTEKSDVSSSPQGDDPPQQSNGMMGARIKSSTSFQNLEISAKDSLRQVVDMTTNMGENMKHKYGSRMDMSRGKYDKLKDDPESDEENSEPGGDKQ
eukprot:GFUD01003879.1.p1 GENE.GFUD01003879.1~~GFUD01003879.1.p1  ORF type:complete len:187 (+),score=88.49 GFUD01003879.1:149-709(+)